jgi:hypothetical protein
MWAISVIFKVISQSSGTDVVIFKIFLPKNLAKKWRS